MTKNIIDKVTDDDTKIVLTNKSVKYVIGLIIFGIMGILGFAWGLYVSVSNDLETEKEKFKTTQTTNQREVMKALDDLKDGQVKLNENKNHDQDLDIVRLLERTDSRANAINGTSERPASTNNNTLPTTIGQ